MKPTFPSFDIFRLLASQDEQRLWEEVSTICAKYRCDNNDNFRAGVFLYCLEAYLRVSYWTSFHNGDAKKGFINAHDAPPMFPRRIMLFAAKHARMLTMKDRITLIAIPEDLAVWTMEHAQSESRSIPASESEFQNAFDQDLGAVAYAAPVGGSSINIDDRQNRFGTKPSVLYTTLRTESHFLTENIEPCPPAAIFSKGHPETCNSSIWGWGRGRWRLVIHFAIVNNADLDLVLYDVHAKVYSKPHDDSVPASVAFGVSIELARDNTILGKVKSIHLRPGNSATISLSLETSLVEPPFETSIVFGLFMDCYHVLAASTRKLRIPSDARYVFQHKPEWGTTRCHFVHRSGSSIDARLADIFSTHFGLAKTRDDGKESRI